MDTVISIFDQWLCHEEGLSPLTRKTYKTVLGLFFRFLAHHTSRPVDLEQLLNLSLRDIRSFLSHRSLQGIANASHSIALSALKIFYRFLTYQGHDVKVPISLLRRPRLPRTLPRPLAYEAISQLLAHLPEGDHWPAWRNYGLMVLLYATGLRIHEALNLNEQDWGQGETLWVRGKHHKERVIPILPQARQAIEHYRQLCPYAQGIPQDPLFWGEKGKRLQPAIFQHYIRQWRRRLNLPEHTTPHSLRHSFASHLLEGGAPLRDVQELLGHTSLKATQRYAEIRPHRLQDIYASLHPRAKITQEASLKPKTILGKKI